MYEKSNLLKGLFFFSAANKVSSLSLNKVTINSILGLSYIWSRVHLGAFDDNLNVDELACTYVVKLLQANKEPDLWLETCIRAKRFQASLLKQETEWIMFKLY